MIIRNTGTTLLYTNLFKYRLPDSFLLHRPLFLFSRSSYKWIHLKTEERWLIPKKYVWKVFPTFNNSIWWRSGVEITVRNIKMSMLSVVAYYQKSQGGAVARGSTSQSVGCGSGLDGFIVNSSPRNKSGISFDAGVKSIRRKTYPPPSCHRHRKNLTHNSPLIPMLKKSKYWTNFDFWYLWNGGVRWVDDVDKNNIRSSSVISEEHD